MENIRALFVLTLAVICGVFCDDFNPEDLQYPCQYNINENCVRNYFRKYGHCTLVQDPKQSAWYKVNIPYYIPKNNLTIVATETHLTNINGDIEAFYLDKETQNLVMAVNFKGIADYIPNAIFAINQKGKEPKVFRETVKATFHVIITAVIPVRYGITARSLKDAHYSAYFPKNDAYIIAGPKFTNSKDPAVAAVFSGVHSDLKTAIQEIFITKASYSFIAYLQNNICNFGLHPALKEYHSTVLENINEACDVDDKTNFYKPCSDTYDVTTCVRNFFEERGSCSAAPNPNDSPVLRKAAFITYVPRVNATLMSTNATVSNLDGKIDSFYINKKTGNLVMSIRFESISSKSTELLIASVRGKQPMTLSFTEESNFPVTLTAVIPINQGLTEMALKKSIITPYFPRSSTSKLGDTLLGSRVPLVRKILNIVNTDFSTIIEELFITKGSHFFLAYLQKYICDFGIPFSAFSVI